MRALWWITFIWRLISHRISSCHTTIGRWGQSISRAQWKLTCLESAMKQHQCRWTIFFMRAGQSIGPDSSGSHSTKLSMLDHLLEVYTGKEQLVHFNADNCVGQNKNKTVMGYMNWRVMTGRNAEKKLSFMTVGHTRCSVDGCFGLIKKVYRRSDTDTINQLPCIPCSEYICKCNQAQAFEWEWKAWDKFLSTFFKPIPSFSKYHHFRFSNDYLGCVFVHQSFGAQGQYLQRGKKLDYTSSSTLLDRSCWNIRA